MDRFEARRVGNRVACIVDDIRVVTIAANQRVGTRSAIEDVVGGVARDRVAESIAGAVDCFRPAQNEVFNVGSKRERHARGHEIDALPGGFDDLVQRVVNDETIVAVTAVENIVSGAAIERIAARAAEELIVAGAAEQFVVALEAEKRVVTSKPEDIVGAGSARQDVLGFRAFDRGHATETPVATVMRVHTACATWRVQRAGLAGNELSNRDKE